MLHKYGYLIFIKNLNGFVPTARKGPASENHVDLIWKTELKHSFQVVNCLPKAYDISSTITKADADVIRSKNPLDIDALQYCLAVCTKCLCWDPVYDDYEAEW